MCVFVCVYTGGEDETKAGDTKENQTADAEPDDTKDSGKEKKSTGSEEKDKTDSKDKKKDKEDDKGNVKEKQVTVKETLNFTLTYLDIPDFTLDSLAKAKKKWVSMWCLYSLFYFIPLTFLFMP